MKNNLMRLIGITLSFMLASAWLPGNLSMPIPFGMVISAEAAERSSSSAVPAMTQPSVAKPEWEQVVAAAKREGKISIYGEMMGTFRERLTKYFKNQYGIEIECVVARGAELVTRYLNERAAKINSADIIMPGMSSTIGHLKPRGVLSPIKPYLILPEVLDTRVWPGGVLPFLDKDERVLSLKAGYTSYLVLNSDLVKQNEVSSYQDLLSPHWKGKIALNDPSISGSGNMWMSFVMLRVMGMEKGEEFFRKLGAQDIYVTTDQRLQLEGLSKGKFAISIAAVQELANDFIRRGAPIRHASLKEGGLITPGNYVVTLPYDPPHPNGATLMLNYLMSKNGQLALTETVGEPPMRVDVPPSEQAVKMGRVAQPGQKVMWITEEQIVAGPTFYSFSKKIFGTR